MLPFLFFLDCGVFVLHSILVMLFHQTWSRCRVLDVEVGGRRYSGTESGRELNRGIEAEEASVPDAHVKAAALVASFAVVRRETVTGSGPRGT